MLFFFSRVLNRPLTSKDFVCSNHFDDNDFVPDEENVDKYGRERKKKRLKPGVIPTLNLHGGSVKVKAKKPKISKSVSKTTAEPIDDNEYYVKDELDYYENNEEISSSAIYNEYNPWSVDNLEHFLYYFCPECEIKISGQEKETFVDHALKNHPKSLECLQNLLTWNNIKEEPLEQQQGHNTWQSPEEYYEEVLKTNVKVEHDFSTENINYDDNEIASDDGGDNNISNLKTETNKIDVQEDPLETATSEIRKKVTKQVTKKQQSKVLNKKLRTCPICKQKVRFLTAHVKYKHSDEDSNAPFRCSECDFRCKFQSNLSKHIKEEHPKHSGKSEIVRFDKNPEDGSITRTFLCKICDDREFTKRSEYQTHYFMKHYKPGLWKKQRCNSVLNEKFIFTCDHCIFAGRLSQVNRHYQKEHPEDTYTLYCSECDFLVSLGENTKNLNWSELKQYYYHLKTHNDTRDFMCSYCPKLFDREQYLRKHIERNHSQDYTKKFVCELCGFKTHLEEWLKKHHRNVHDESKKAQCPYCEYKNAYKFLIDVHIDHKHPETGEIAHYCKVCNKGFIHEYTARWCRNRHQRNNTKVS